MSSCHWCIILTYYSGISQVLQTYYIHMWYKEGSLSKKTIFSAGECWVTEDYQALPAAAQGCTDCTRGGAARTWWCPWAAWYLGTSCQCPPEWTGGVSHIIGAGWPRPATGWAGTEWCTWATEWAICTEHIHLCRQEEAWIWTADPARE